MCFTARILLNLCVTCNSHPTCVRVSVSVLMQSRLFSCINPIDTTRYYWVFKHVNCRPTALQLTGKSVHYVKGIRRKLWVFYPIVLKWHRTSTYKDATSPIQWVRALYKPKAHTIHIRYKAPDMSWGPQSTTIISRHFPKVHKHLSHTYNNDPRVHHDYMFFTCIFNEFFNIYFIANVL